MSYFHIPTYYELNRITSVNEAVHEKLSQVSLLCVKYTPFLFGFKKTQNK